MDRSIVSIIVPVYNAQKYLERCLNSIACQTYPHFEVIMVDDGSSDGSPAICDAFVQKDSRFKVVHQKNQGPSAARNTGLKQIAGEYLCCVDSDDVLRADALEKLVDRMRSSGADVCVYAWNKLYEDGTSEEFRFPSDQTITDPEDLYRILMQGKHFGGGAYPWNKIWKLDPSKEYGGMRLFDESIRFFEDMLWTVENIESRRKIIFINECLYDYYVLSSSISRRGDEIEREYECCRGARRVYEYIRDNHPSVEGDAQRWYRIRFYIYMRAKQKNGVRLNAQDKITAKVFSLHPSLFRSFGQWLKFLYVRFFG